MRGSRILTPSSMPCSRRRADDTRSVRRALKHSHPLGDLDSEIDRGAERLRLPGANEHAAVGEVGGVLRGEFVDPLVGQLDEEPHQLPLRSVVVHAPAIMQPMAVRHEE